MIKNVIFDWDGTIIDNTKANYEIAMFVFKKNGVKPISLEEFRNQMISPFMKFYNKFIPDLTFENEINDFREGSLIIGEKELYSKIFPKAAQTIRKFYENGIKMVILSSALKSAITKGLEFHSMQDYFIEIKAEVPDKSAAINEIMESQNFIQEETMIVGDMDSDIRAGKNAGITTVGVTYGFYTKNRIESMKPDHVINEFCELETVINKQSHSI